MIARYPRYFFWRVLAQAFGALAKFTRRRAARFCGCMECYFVLNHERIVSEALLNAQREITGQVKVDRRPS